jgi:serine/threonine-protein kinase
MTTSAGPDLRGRAIGNWTLQRPLGEGTFGAVYEAQHVSIAGRRAAIKVLHPHMAFNADIKRRFVNEASAASRADHENIVQVFDGGVTDDGLCYAVMEFLKGAPLSQVIARDGALGVPRTANIGMQVASALKAAHAIQIVHRDLKPDNIFVVARESNREFVKVLDFGIAKLRDDEAHATRTGMLMGTPAYMSPEQWQTRKDVDGRADVYALGVILFECVTGGLPFRGNTQYDWLDAHLNQPVPEPMQFVPMPGELNTLLLRMLEKDRALRPQTMDEVIVALERLRRPSQEMPTVVGPPSLPMPAQRPSAIPRTDVPRTQAPLPIAPTAPAPASIPPVAGATVPPPAPRALWPIAIAGLAALGGGALFFLRPQPALAPVVAPPVEKPPPVAEAPFTAPAGMVLVPAGKFTMGREPYGNKNALDVPAHPVETRGFAIGRTEVSARDFREFAADQHVQWSGGRDEEPATNVSFDDAQAYCKWKLSDGRLPTEEEWEHAARGDDGRLYPTGARLNKKCVNGLKGPGGALAPVDANGCGATPSGLLNLSGNAWEWVAGAARPYPGSSLPPPGEGLHVVRGGSFYNTNPDELTTTFRSFVPEPNRFVGFRCLVGVK